MSHAERCPLCKGEGKLPAGKFDTGYIHTLPVTCHGCDGKGWVPVPDPSAEKLKQHLEQRLKESQG